jgi:hypothetical protein
MIKKKNNSFKTYQKRNVTEKCMKIKDAIKEAKKKKLRISFPLISKMTGISYQTLKSKGEGGREYKAIIETAIFESKGDGQNFEESKRTPRNLEEAKALISALTYRYDSLKSKYNDLLQTIKDPEYLLEMLGYETSKVHSISQHNLAADFCLLFDRLFETCHLDFDDKKNIIGRGLKHDIRAPHKLAQVYVSWKHKLASS